MAVNSWKPIKPKISPGQSAPMNPNGGLSFNIPFPLKRTLTPPIIPTDPQAQYKDWIKYAQPIIDEMMSGMTPSGSESASFYNTFGGYLDAATKNKGRVNISNATELADMMKQFSDWQVKRRKETGG